MRRISGGAFCAAKPAFSVVGSILVVLSISTATASGQATSSPAASKAPVPGDPQQNPAASAYTLGTTTLTIDYETRRNDDTGVSTVQNGTIDPGDQKIKIKWQTPTGVPATDLVFVALTVSYKGVTKTFKSHQPIARSDDSYPFDSNMCGQFAADLVTWLKNRLPRNFDPNTVIVLDGPVVVTVLPVISITDPAAAAVMAPPQGAAQGSPQVPPKGSPQAPPKGSPQPPPRPSPQSPPVTYELGTGTRTTNDLTVTLTPQ